jgi:hypothetical protein
MRSNGVDSVFSVLALFKKELSWHLANLFEPLTSQCEFIKSLVELPCDAEAKVDLVRFRQVAE